MRKYIIIVMAIMLLSCEREVEYEQEGVLTGPDLALCVCCGGVILSINADNHYRVDSLPGMNAQEFYNLDFPKSIKFNAVPATTCGGLDHLTITGYRFVN